MIFWGILFKYVCIRQSVKGKEIHCGSNQKKHGNLSYSNVCFHYDLLKNSGVLCQPISVLRCISYRNPSFDWLLCEIHYWDRMDDIPRWKTFSTFLYIKNSQNAINTSQSLFVGGPMVNIQKDILHITHPANIYLFKVNSRNPRKRCELYSKLTIKTQERRFCC